MKAIVRNVESMPVVTIKDLIRAIDDAPLPPTDQEIIGWDWIGRCPNCGASVNATMEHCDNCGQALDWRYNDDKN